MKRDMDLIRQILLEIEADKRRIEVEGYEQDVVFKHIELLEEAGYVHGSPQRGDDKIYAWGPLRLTWMGHEFLDTARDEVGWKAVMKRLGKTAGTTSIVVIQQLLVEAAKGRLLQ